MKIIYSDSGVFENNKQFNNRTFIVLHDGKKCIMEKYLGDFTINEGELTGIVYAMKRGADIVRTDSRTAQSWVLQGWTEEREKSLRKGLLTERHKNMIDFAHIIYLLLGRPKIQWVSRNVNLAGKFIERKYHA